MKMTLNREFYVKAGATKVQHKASTAVVYAYEANGRFYLQGFSGRKAKPDFHYWYPTSAKRELKAQGFFAAVQAAEELVAARKAERSRPHTLKIGDVLVSSWGYSMTLVDFYEVIEITKHGATLEKIGDTLVTGEAGYSGTLVADPAQRTGKTLKVRVPADNSPKVRDNGWARVWDGKPCYFNRMD